MNLVPARVARNIKIVMANKKIKPGVYIKIIKNPSINIVTKVVPCQVISRSTKICFKCPEKKFCIWNPKNKGKKLKFLR